MTLPQPVRSDPSMEPVDLLQELRARGLITFGQSRLTVHDWDELARVGEFRADYLHLRQPASSGPLGP